MKKGIQYLIAFMMLFATYASFTDTSVFKEAEVQAKTDDYVPSRMEYYWNTKDKRSSMSASRKEHDVTGAECVVTVDIKGNKGKSDFRNSYKKSKKFKGTSTTGTGTDVCTYVQKKQYITVGFSKANDMVEMYDGQNRISVLNQGQKRIYTTSIYDKKLLAKYRKLGYIKPNSNYLKTIMTINVKNPKIAKNKTYKKMKDYKRTPSISPKNVVINNINSNDGVDSFTVKGLKKGTKLSIYNTRGQLMRVVSPSSSTYTVKMKQDEDITKYFESQYGEKAFQFILSRTEPNGVESYRIRYAIPKEKANVRTPYQEHSQIKEGKSVLATIFLTNDKKYGMESGISFYSMTGNQPAKYRIKQGNQVVYEIEVTKKDLQSEKYKNDYVVVRKVLDNEFIGIQKVLKPISLAYAKSLTITAQVAGKKESFPISFYFPKGDESLENAHYTEFFE